LKGKYGWGGVRLIAFPSVSHSISYSGIKKRMGQEEVSSDEGIIERVGYKKGEIGVDGEVWHSFVIHPFFRPPLLSFSLFLIPG